MPKFRKSKSQEFKSVVVYALAQAAHAARAMQMQVVNVSCSSRDCRQRAVTCWCCQGGSSSVVVI